MKDLYHNVAVSQVLDPATVTSTQTSAAIDLRGYDSLSVAFALGQSGDTLSGSVYWTLKLQDSDDDASYSDVAASGVLNTAATITVDDAAEDSAVYTIGYTGGKRYVKAVATATGTHSNGTPMAIVALRGTPSLAPVL